MHRSRLLPLVIATLAVACGTGTQPAETTQPPPVPAPEGTTGPGTSVATTPTSTVASSTTTTTTTTTSATEETAPTPGDGPPPGSLTEFEALWLCERSRHTYTDLSEIDRHRSDLLSEAGLSQDDYQAFRASLDDDPAARAEVMEAYLEVCGGD
ncbi:MAG: hypothetical protein ACLFWM_11350 [Actinomycetota bacterium]